MIYPDGRKYSGDFQNGIIEGQGTLTLPDGTRYTGTFRNGTYIN
jgi:hypothetical protein